MTDTNTSLTEDNFYTRLIKGKDLSKLLEEAAIEEVNNQPQETKKNEPAQIPDNNYNISCNKKDEEAIDRLEDVLKFETVPEQLTLYGKHFRQRLQEKHPEIVFDDMTHSRCPVFYKIGVKKEIQRKGLKRLFSGKTKKVLNVLIELDVFKAVIIRDVRLRKSAEKILKELDAISGETYSTKITYSKKEEYLPFKE